jgi:hypothetical protein
VTQLDLLTDMLVRVFFILIQVILLLIFENKLHLFQARTLLVVTLNALLLATKIQINPLATFLLLTFISGPRFQRI